MKIAFVGSSGGHLTQLLLMRPWWERHDRFWVTFDKPDARSGLGDERVYWCHHPTNRNVPNLVRNSALAWRVVRHERPDVIISTGAAVAVPFFVLGRLFGALTVFIEVYDRVASPTLTGRLVYPIAHRFVVQWPEQQRFYPKAELFGELL